MYQNHKVAVLVAAAGSGKRMGAGPSKQYRLLGGMPILSRAVLAFDRHPMVDSIYIIGREEELDYCRKEMLQPYGFTKIRGLVAGGKERQDSVKNGLDALEDETLVLVHDGARPFVTAEVISQTIQMTGKRGAAICAVPAKDTIKVAKPDPAEPEMLYFTETPDRSTLYQVQTPQGFLTDLLKEAHERAMEQKFYGTDDAVLVERLGKKVYLVMGDYTNIKVTTPEDMETGKVILKMKEERTVEYRMGTGYDVHKLVEERKLILGGVEIPYEKGLLGHSDADVLVHAVMDALLGAAALRDIGYHFPDSDETYRGADSLKLLEEVIQLLDRNGFIPVNVDGTVIAQRPKISPYIPQMCENMAKIIWPELPLEESLRRINIKGTTTEKLGFCGRGEGIASEAAACIRTK